MSQDNLHDLMMLLDGVLEPADEAMLRARLEDEPELAATWHQLKSMRAQLKTELQSTLKPDFTARVMTQVQATPQVAPGLMQRLQKWLTRPIAVPVAVAAALLVMWSIGLPQPAPPPELASPALAVTPVSDGPRMAAGETEIESIDNQTNYNVLVLAAPGSPNRMIWLSQRNLNDEG